MPSKNEQPTMEITETPDGHPVLEVVEKVPPKPLSEKELLKRISKIEAKIQSCDDRVEMFTGELAGYKANEKKVQTDVDREIGEIMDKFDSSRHKQALEELLKMPTPKLDQLKRTITNTTGAILDQKRKRHKLAVEMKELEKQVSDIHADEAAKAFFEATLDWIESKNFSSDKFKVAKDCAARASALDVRFSQRAKRLGYGPEYEVIGDSYFKPANLPRLSEREAEDMIADLGDAYGTVLIKKDYDRQADVPLAREKFMPDYGALGATK